jgi:hypothetical protein
MRPRAAKRMAALKPMPFNGLCHLRPCGRTTAGGAAAESCGRMAAGSKTGVARSEGVNDYNYL